MEKHKFVINFLKLSVSDEFESALDEWELFLEETNKEKKIQCICQRVIQNIYFFYNKQSKYTITVGSTCKNKFMKVEKELDHPILKRIFSNAISKGQYRIIDNILEYTSDMQQEAIHHIQNNLENATSIATLKSLKTEVKYLIEDCDIDYLAEVYHNIENKLTKTINQEKELKIKKYKKLKKKKHGDIILQIWGNRHHTYLI